MARNKFDVDETYESKFNSKLIQRLLVYVLPYKKNFIITIILMLVSSIVGLLAPVLLGDAIDNKIPQKDIGGLFVLGGVYLVILLVSFTALKLRILFMSRLAQNVISNLRKDLFIHLQKLPFAYYDSRPHGKIIVRAVNYVNSLSELLSGGLVNIISDMISLIFIIGFMLYLNVQLTLITLLGVPVVTTAMIFIKNSQRRRWRKYNNKQSNLNAYLHESAAGIRVIQGFTREKFNLDIFNRENRNMIDAWMRAVKVQFLMMPTIENVSSIISAAVYMLGVQWITDATLTTGTLIAFVSYVSRFWQPILNLGNFYNQIINTMSYLERIFETMDEPISIKDSPNAKEMPLIKGDVKFENVFFKYDEGGMVLKDANFNVNTGETIALVGATGSGKTTIINLLSRFYDVTEGKVLVDNIDIRDVKIDSLRKQMGVMLQDTFIFSGTIYDNIRYGKLDATDEEVTNAAKTVMAHDFIMQLEHGYKTEVNERGSSLSTGQRQLISFARALLADPKILILDEATSSIDSETERLLQIGLDKLLKGRTSFVIAHRLSTIKNATRIMYIEHGSILESGSHDELIAAEGAYYQLYKAQYDALKAV